MVITIKDDFDLEKIVESGQCFRPKKMDDGSFRFITRDNVLYIKPVEKDTFDVNVDENEWNNVWAKYFNLSIKYKKIRASIDSEDKFMINAAKYGQGIRILVQDPFEMLISFIISQRKSIPAIRTSIEKICTIYGKKISTDRDSFHLFPTAEDILNKGADKLTECSLGYRLPYVKQACEDIVLKNIDLEYAADLDDDNLLSYLMEIKGVGIKVASCIALFAYNRGAIAPVDVWIDRVISNHYGGISPFPGYKENSGIYQQYAFFAAKALENQ